MKYPYRCSNCNKEIELELSIKEELPKEVVCSECEGSMKRIWQTSNVTIPEHMRAGNETPWKYGKRPVKKYY
jgi:DNA-directed RNA polymerase subunit RPC12/RpoP